MSIRSNVDARRFDQKVRIERRVTTQNPTTGSSSTTWQLVATVWASIDATKANERFSAAAVTQVDAYTVWIRYRDDIDTSCRLVWRGRAFEIKSIPDQQRRGRLLALFCEVGLSAG